MTDAAPSCQRNGAALAGIRILDLSRGPAAGLATMILADFGAEVLVVDPPFDDLLQKLPAAPLWRRGKRSLRLDLTRPEACETFDELCAGADVLVTSWRPAALERKLLQAGIVQQRHPHLTYCHITGFGPDGPYADYPWV